LSSLSSPIRATPPHIRRASHPAAQRPPPLPLLHTPLRTLLPPPGDGGAGGRGAPLPPASAHPTSVTPLNSSPATRTCTAPKTEPRPSGSGRSGPVHRHPNPPERRRHAPTPTSSAPKGRRAVATGAARPPPRPSGTRGSRLVLGRCPEGAEEHSALTHGPERRARTHSQRSRPFTPASCLDAPCLDAFFFVICPNQPHHTSGAYHALPRRANRPSRHSQLHPVPSDTTGGGRSVPYLPPLLHFPPPAAFRNSPRRSLTPSLCDLCTLHVPLPRTRMRANSRPFLNIPLPPPRHRLHSAHGPRPDQTHGHHRRGAPRRPARPHLPRRAPQPPRALPPPQRPHLPGPHRRRALRPGSSP